MSANKLVEGQGTETQRPNVRLARGQKPVTTDGVVNIGTTPGMHLPSEKEQRDGFWVSHPEVLITQYYPVYKYALGVGISEQALDSTMTETPKPATLGNQELLNPSEEGSVTQNAETV